MMSAANVPNHFYTTLFSNASVDIYDQNTHADFTVKLAQSVDLGSAANWEVGLCELSCSSPPVGDAPVLIYCNLVPPQFVGESTVRCMRTIAFPTPAKGRQEFRNVQYVPVEQRRFQDIRIEMLTSEGLHVPFEDSSTPTKWCYIFARITSGSYI